MMEVGHPRKTMFVLKSALPTTRTQRRFLLSLRGTGLVQQLLKI